MYPAFSMSTLPPPDVTRGTTKAVDAVLEASRAYTVHWQDARERLNEEVDRQLSLANKIEGPGGDPGSGSGGRGGDGRGSEGRRAGSGGNTAAEDGSAPKATLDRLEELLEQRRDLRGRRPGSAFEDAKARGEAPFSGPDDALGSGDRVVVDDKIMPGPFRGFRQADVDSSNLGDELKKTLLNMANHDPFMRKLLDRREQSRKDGERLRVRQEEREKIIAEAKVAVAQEVREEVRAEAMVELQPEVESMDVLKDRARFEVMAELQEERKGIDEERASMERERVRIREEEQANVRREMMMNVISGGEAPAGDGGGVAVAERVAVEPVRAAGGGRREEGGGGDEGGQDGEGGRDVRENGNGHVAVVPGRPEPEGELGLFDDGGGLVLFDGNDFGAYEGPDDAASGNGPVSVEPVAVAAGGDAEAPVEGPVDGRVQRSREEWLTVSGIELPEGPVARKGGEDSGTGVMDREAVEGYISGLGRGLGGPVEKRENGTRESKGEKAGVGEGALGKHASSGEGSDDGGVDGGLKGTGDSDGAAGAGDLEVDPDGNGPRVEAGPAGGADAVVLDADLPDSGPELDVEPVMIPQVVGEGGDLDEGLVGGDAPGLSDVLSDIGQDSLEEVGRYGPKPLPKFYRRSESGGDTGQSDGGRGPRQSGSFRRSEGIDAFAR